MPRFPRKDILYYYHHFDRLTESLLPGGSLLSALHRKLVFALSALPPSSKWFSAAQALLAEVTAATGDAKLDALANLVAALVQQRQALHQQMVQGGMTCPMMQNMQGMEQKKY